MNKLKELRKLHNYTIKDMAKMLNISTAYYWQIENNKRNLYYKTAIDIAKIFNLKPDDIFYKK
jgi:DNA-binding XRE family transcriptional regulator